MAAPLEEREIFMSELLMMQGWWPGCFSLVHWCSRSQPPEILQCLWSSLWWYLYCPLCKLFVFMVYWQAKYLFKKICTNTYSVTVHSAILTLSAGWLTCSVVSSCGRLWIFKGSATHHQQNQWLQLHTKAVVQYSLNVRFACPCVFTVARDVVGCSSQGCGLSLDCGSARTASVHGTWYALLCEGPAIIT